MKRIIMNKIKLFFISVFTAVLFSSCFNTDSDKTKRESFVEPLKMETIYPYINDIEIVNDSQVVAVSIGEKHTVGLKNNGTVVAIGNNEKGQCNVQDWENIVSVVAGYNHTVGLKEDGTVVACGDNEEGLCDVQNWKDLIESSEEVVNSIDNVAANDEIQIEAPTEIPTMPIDEPMPIAPEAPAMDAPVLEPPVMEEPAPVLDAPAETPLTPDAPAAPEAPAMPEAPAVEQTPTDVNPM